MNEETFKQTLICLERLKPNILIISGGEFTEHPLFYSYILRLIEASKKWTEIFKISLLSNGFFILNEKRTDEIKELLKLKEIIALQITIGSFYTNGLPILQQIDRIKALSPKVFIGEANMDLVNLGRASKNHLALISKIRKPFCSNLYLLPRQIRSLKSVCEIIQILETTKYNLCKPTIDSVGKVHAGESLNCQIIGTIFDTPEQIFQILTRSKCCNKCKNYDHLPKEAKLILD